MNVNTPEFEKVIEDLIDNLQPEQFSDVEEYNLAQKYHALPLGFDLLAYVFLTPDGKVIWEDFEETVGGSNDLQGLIRVLVAGKRRYPQLAKFIPNRSAESKDCPLCGGFGILKQSKDIVSGKPRKCFICAGLGWVTEETYLEVLENSK